VYKTERPYTEKEKIYILNIKKQNMHSVIYPRSREKSNIEIVLVQYNIIAFSYLNNFFCMSPFLKSTLKEETS